jgi:small-conductance mechanosensitive channel
LFEVADKNPLCLEEPKPLFIFQGFGDSSLNIQFSVWAKRENFLDLRNSLQLEIKAAFDENGIEIPFPHRTLYTGSATDPFPVYLTGRAKTDAVDSA